MARAMEREGSRRRDAWVISVGLGAAALLFTTFGPGPLVVALAVGMYLAHRHGGVLGVSGVLTGAGVLWTLLITSALASGAGLDNAAGWVAMGLVPGVLGLVLLVDTMGKGESAGPSG